MRGMWRWVVAVAAVVGVGVGVAAAGTGGNQWPSAGQNIQNTRSNAAESKIGVGNVANLQVKWSFTTGGDVSATPAVDAKTVYFPDWGGQLYAVDKKTGQLKWQTSIASATGRSHSWHTTQAHREWKPGSVRHALVMPGRSMRQAPVTSQTISQGPWL